MIAPEVFLEPICTFEALLLRLMVRWDELRQIEQFLTFSGRQPRDQNLPFLPKAIRGLLSKNISDPKLSIANWEYRVVCNPVEDVPCPHPPPFFFLSPRFFFFSQEGYPSQSLQTCR